MTREEVLNFLKEEEICVLATANKDAKPEAAVMVFVARDDFSFWLFTDERTRKLANLRENSQASLVIGGFGGGPTVQTDGEVTILEGEEVQKAREFLLGVHPDWKAHFGEATVFLRFDPTWLRYSDYSKDPAEISVFEEF